MFKKLIGTLGFIAVLGVIAWVILQCAGVV